MKYKFCAIRINVTKYDVTFVTKGGFNPQTLPNHGLKLTFYLLSLISLTSY